MLSTFARVLAKHGKPQPALAVFSAPSNNYATEASFETKPYKTYRLDNGPSTTVSCTRDDALKYYKQMQVMRRLESAAGNLYKEKLVRGFCHLYTGQEAVAVGMKGAMRHQDSIISSYRIHGWTHLMGVPVFNVLAELTGRQSGCARGKGGSMHMYCPYFYGGNGIVGAQVPLGVGIAYADLYLNTGGVCLALYGDGASQQGQIFEVYNMAALWKIPCIFVCENNGYGMGTSVARHSANTNFYDRGDTVPGIWVDGMDVLAVREATRFAIDHCVSGKGPMLMEVATYRYAGHSMSDPGTSYRTRDEVQEVRHTRDAITSFKEKIISTHLVKLDELKDIDHEVKTSVDEAYKKSKTDPEIPLAEMTYDIYSEPLEKMVRGTTPWEWWEHKRLGPAVNLK